MNVSHNSTGKPMQTPAFFISAMFGPRAALKRALLLALPLVLVACATTPTGTPQEQVQQRATQRWKLMLAKDFEKAHAFTTSGFKAVIKAQDYRNRFGGAGLWLGAEVAKVDCPEAAKCIVRVRLNVRHPLKTAGADDFSTGLEETWLLEGGQWVIFEDVKGS
jgi:hypothetical protein